MLNLVSDIEENSDGVFPISKFQFLVKSLINKDCQNSETSNDIDMKLGPVAKLDKRNTLTSKNFDDNVVSVNYYAIFFSDLSLIWSNLEPRFQTHGL